MRPIIIHGYGHLARIIIKGLALLLALYILIVLTWAVWETWPKIFNDNVRMTF